MSHLAHHHQFTTFLLCIISRRDIDRSGSNFHISISLWRNIKNSTRWYEWTIWKFWLVWLKNSTKNLISFNMLTFDCHFCLKFLLPPISYIFHFLFFSFYSADHGKVLKTINAASADDSSKVSSVVIEELDVLSKPEPIRTLKIVRTTQYGE